VRFWDSSAVVPLLVQQAASDRVAGWATDDRAIVLWTLTPVEVVSALRRLVREQDLDEDVARAAEARMEALVQACHVVVDVEGVKALASRLLRVHPLRAADALQLGAALHWTEGHPLGQTLHTLDARLAVAAQRESFTVIS
jgi:predicted nucleic acid-binding protein